MAVLRFSWFRNADRVKKMEAELLSSLSRDSRASLTTEIPMTFRRRAGKAVIVLPNGERAIERREALIDNTMVKLNMIQNRVGPFEPGVIGSPFHEICDRLTGSAPGGVKQPQQALLHALKEAGWQDMGRLGSADYPNKKHIFCAPELKHYRKSDLRRMVEVANNSNSATDQNE